MLFVASPEGIAVKADWAEAEELVLALAAAHIAGVGGELLTGLRVAIEKRLAKGAPEGQ